MREFKRGDYVKSKFYGYGTVTDIENDDYPVVVRFEQKNRIEFFTQDGFWQKDNEVPLKNITHAEPETAALEIKVTVPNPKPNAPSYKIETLNDIFKVVTTENIDKFFDELKSTMTLAVAMKQIASEVNKEGAEQMSFGEYVWVDD